MDKDSSFKEKSIEDNSGIFNADLMSEIKFVGNPTGAVDGIDDFASGGGTTMSMPPDSSDIPGADIRHEGSGVTESVKPSGIDINNILDDGKISGSEMSDINKLASEDPFLLNKEIDEIGKNFRGQG